jgi:hypothetical protein
VKDSHTHKADKQTNKQKNLLRIGLAEIPLDGRLKQLHYKIKGMKSRTTKANSHRTPPSK